ncbi:MAG: 23S rRNA (pseudouridine(1915)-N(3))-methyltransferase RlmH [Lachnospirales bacterium]
MKVFIFIEKNREYNNFKEIYMEYLKRLKYKTEIFYFKNEKDIMNKLPKKYNLIQVVNHGYYLTSEDFAKKIYNCENTGNDLCFYLSNSLDLAKIKSDPLNISNIVSSNNLALTLLLEQIYRATTILDGKTYHK